jgi:hypothetical protein
MDIIQPKMLGFKGQYAQGTQAVPVSAGELLTEFFRPINRQLDELLADHPIPWRPFTAEHNGKDEDADELDVLREHRR